MAVDRKVFGDSLERERVPARIDGLDVIPPIERIPSATATLLAELKLKLRPTQKILGDKRVEDTQAYNALQQMLAEFFPVVNMDLPIDISGTTRSTHEFIAEIFQIRRKAHLAMAVATIDSSTPNAMRSSKARAAIPLFEDARRVMDQRLSSVIIPEQRPHTIYVARLTDGVMARSTTENIGQLLNPEVAKRLIWR